MIYIILAVVLTIAGGWLLYGLGAVMSKIEEQK